MKQYHYHDVDFRGTIERVIYTVTTPAGKILNKYANVYLPYGYDASDLAKRYNISVSKLASGVPLGGDLDNIDEQTIAASLAHRRPY